MWPATTATYPPIPPARITVAPTSNTVSFDVSMLAWRSDGAGSDKLLLYGRTVGNGWWTWSNDGAVAALVDTVQDGLWLQAYPTMPRTNALGLFRAAGTVFDPPLAIAAGTTATLHTVPLPSGVMPLVNASCTTRIIASIAGNVSTASSAQVWARAMCGSVVCSGVASSSVAHVNQAPATDRNVHVTANLVFHAGAGTALSTLATSVEIRVSTSPAGSAAWAFFQVSDVRVEVAVEPGM